MTTTLAAKRLLLLIALLACTVPSEAQPPSHFSECTTRTASNATVVVPTEATISMGNDSIAPGDEIAVFNAANRCVGAATWTGENIALTVWGAGEFTEDEEGLQTGERMNFRIWDQSQRQERGAGQAVTLTFSDKHPYLTTENRYVPDGIYVIRELRIEHEAQAAR